MKESIVPDSAKAFGQYMLHDEVQEIFPVEGSIPHLFATAFDILKSHLTILIGNDISFTDDATVQVSRQVFQGGYPFSHIRAINYPFFGNSIGNGQSGFSYCLQETGAKNRPGRTTCI
jgi:hypothetical protein